MESDLEQALINNLQLFLLELGKGFAFVSRQERITLDGDHFYIDLVFYHTVLSRFCRIAAHASAIQDADPAWSSTKSPPSPARNSGG